MFFIGCIDLRNNNDPQSIIAIRISFAGWVWRGGQGVRRHCPVGLHSLRKSRLAEGLISQSWAGGASCSVHLKA